MVMNLARIAHFRLPADGLYWYMDMPAERISRHIQRCCWHFTGSWQSLLSAGR
jgi:hypothetical protein